VKALRNLLNNTIRAFSSARLFLNEPKIYFRPKELFCPICYRRLKVMKTETTTMVTLHIGKFKAHKTFLICGVCKNKIVYTSSELQGLVPEHCNFGYDILIDVGCRVFQKYRTAKEIVKALEDKNIFLSESEVYFLARKFITYLGIAHRESGSGIRKFMQKNGGYLLHIDGTCDGSSQHLITVIDAISGFVLHSIKIPTENSSQIIPMLREIKKTYGDPLAIVSDMGKAFMRSMAIIFKETPHFICHFHFLRDIGKDLIMNDYKVIQKKLKAYGISTLLQKRIRSYEETSDSNPHIVDQLVSNFKAHNLSTSFLSGITMKVACHAFLLWAFKGKSQGNAYGFPFDRQHFVFYQRLNIVYSRLQEIMESCPQDRSEDIKLVHQLINDLEPLINDKLCMDITPNIIEKIKVFDKLRDAMRIAPVDGRDGLNDDGQDIEMKTIEQAVKKFYYWLTNKYADNKDYKKMIVQIERYWEKLFADPIIVNTSAGERKIQPQRTNNIMEQFFRKLKKIFLRKSGINSMAETLCTMLADVPLIKNLGNSDYMNILLNGKKSLEERFAVIDADSVRKEMKKNGKQNKKEQKKLQNIINDIEFTEKLTNIIKLGLTA
jgi:hypothetical protein